MFNELINNPIIQLGLLVLGLAAALWVKERNDRRERKVAERQRLQKEAQRKREASQAPLEISNPKLEQMLAQREPEVPIWISIPQGMTRDQLAQRPNYKIVVRPSSATLPEPVETLPTLDEADVVELTEPEEQALSQALQIVNAEDLATRLFSQPPARPWFAVAGEANVALPLLDWYPYLLREVVHLLIVGETNAGKSTHARALLAVLTQLGFDCCIVDPHAKFNDWGGDGVRIIGDGRNWDEIDRFFIAWEGELDRRYMPGEPVGRPLYVFIDEYPTINANCEHASAVFKTQAREGRKPNMHAFFLVQESTVEALGIQGEGTVRNNFSKLLLGSYAVRASRLSEQSDYPAAFDHRGKCVAVDTAEIATLTTLEVIRDRIWMPPAFTHRQLVEAMLTQSDGNRPFRIRLANSSRRG